MPKSDHFQDENRLVIVCAECLRASCFQGYLYCDHYKDAGTVEIPLCELQRLGLENRRYWDEPQ